MNTQATRQHPGAVLPRSPHAICELARPAACGCCAASGREWPCVQSAAGPDGFHLARFADARRRGLITAVDFAAITATISVITSAAVIYDDTFGTGT
jgi:hypothetical protein